MKGRNKAFTVVELLTVITIIAILVGFLLPALTKVKTMVKETKQKAQLNTISLAIRAFKNDMGYYPESDYWNLSNLDYSGAQMLSEALLGWDLLGFHPESDWESDGEKTNSNLLYDLVNQGTLNDQKKELDKRIGPYIDRVGVEVFHLADIYDNTLNLEGAKTYVISDVFHYQKITDSDIGRSKMVGAPILYYRARTQFKAIYPQALDMDTSLYDYRDNMRVIQAKSTQDIVDNIKTQPHAWLDPDNFYSTDPEIPSIIDSQMRNIRPWPYRPDTYLLISAGADGEYGTRDDITNFK